MAQAVVQARVISPRAAHTEEEVGKVAEADAAAFHNAPLVQIGGVILLRHPSIERGGQVTITKASTTQEPPPTRTLLGEIKDEPWLEEPFQLEVKGATNATAIRFASCYSLKIYYCEIGFLIVARPDQRSLSQKLRVLADAVADLNPEELRQLADRIDHA